MTRRFAVAALLLVALGAHAQNDILPTGKSGVRTTEQYAILGNHAFFAAMASGDGSDLWRTDGTPEGTARFTDFAPDADVWWPRTVGDRVLFFVTRGTTTELWTTDGETTAMVLAIEGDSLDHVTTDGRTLWFTIVQNGRSYVWRTDGTAGGTHAAALAPEHLRSMKVAQDVLFIVTGRGELWRSDGTAAGTFRLTTDVLYYAPWETLHGVALFYKGHALWRSDGTEAGTYALAELSYSITPVAKTSTSAYVLTHPERLVETDSTVAGTRFIEIGVTPWTLGVLHDRLYLFARDGVRMVAGAGVVDVAPAIGYAVRLAMEAANALWIPGYQNGLAESLWHFDGSTSTLIRSNFAGPIDGFITLGDKALFFASDFMHGREPWVSDGTPAGTRILANTWPEAALTGTVVDQNGAPIANAEVTVHREERDAFGVTTSRRRVYHTDGAGRFVAAGLPDGTYFLSVWRYGYVRTWWRNSVCLRDWYCKPADAVAIEVRDAVTMYGFDMVVRQMGVVRGRVVDSDGKPVLYAAVYAAEVIGATPVGTTWTDANGQYSMYVPPDHPWIVYTAARRHANVSRDGVRVASGASVEIDFTLKPSGSIAGRLLDAVTGEALTLYAIVAARNVATNETVSGYITPGGYTITLPDGQWELTIHPIDMPYAPVTYPRLVSAEPAVAMEGFDVELMPAGARVGGRVIDAASGKGIAGLTVLVLRGDEEVASVFTDANGRYATRPELEPGTYVVRIEASPTRPGAMSQPVTVAGTDARIVDFVLGRYPIVTGIVVDAVTREPLRNVRVGADAVTDVNGRYAMVAVAGPLTAQKMGWSASTREVPAGSADGQVDFELAPSCSLKPSSTHAIANDRITIPLTGDCTACASTTSPYIRFDRSCVKNELTVYVEKGRSGTIALPGIRITVEGR